MKKDRESLRQLTPEDFLELRAFYWDLIDAMKESPYFPGWEKEVYPSDALLRDALARGEIYALRQDGQIVAAMIMNHECNEGYQGTDWSVDAAPGEVSILHALGVSPRVQGQGIAGYLVREAIRLAREQGQRALRLDVLDGNEPAMRLYTREGFAFRRTLEMYYEDTGWTTFHLYEYVL